VIVYSLIKGAPDHVESSLRRTLGALTRHGDFHQKVGITNDPDRRWRQGYRDFGWRRMTVVYETSHYPHTQSLERRLVEWLKQSRSGGYYHNSAPGGEGRPPLCGPYYVYIVGAQKFCRFVWE
jgi:hypothetical protein